MVWKGEGTGVNPPSGDSNVQEAQALEAEFVKSSEALGALIRSEIDVQIATAKAYPRTLSLCLERITELATHDRATAEECWYSLPREGKVIDGPSVRLAEIVASSFGNLRYGSRIVGIAEKFVTAQGFCHDLESNVATTVEVKRRITKKNGKRFSDDMILITSNAAGAIAFRNAIFKVIPSALLKTVFANIRKVGMGDERTLAQTRDAVFTYFAGQGIVEDRVLALVEKRGKEDVTLEDVANLRGLATAIKEGTSTLDDAFPVAKGPALLDAGKHEAGKRKATAKQEPPPDETATEGTDPQPEGELKWGGDAPKREPGEEG